MAESVTTRLSLPRWTADTDTPNRTEFDSGFANLEALAAGFRAGTAAARPAAAAALDRYYYWSHDTDELHVCVDTTGAGGWAWLKVARQSDLDAHAAAADPHPGYLTPAEGDAAYVNEPDHTKAAHDALGLAHGSLAGLTGTDHHTQYLNTGRHDATTRHPISVLGDGGGLGLRQVVRYLSSGTFDKANYPWARAVRIICCGGGGGGGGAALTGPGEVAAAGGGGGAAVTYTDVIAVGALAASETVTVGAGGAGGAAGASNNGATGGTSALGAHGTASGGQGGLGSSARARSNAAGGRGGTTGTGLVGVWGTGGGGGFGVSDRGISGAGGASHLGGGGEGRNAHSAGVNGQGYGGGGSGAVVGENHSTGGGGGAGATGAVFVELYA